ncbi:MAG: phytoene/squalene synthase family protein [Magnetospiraceae bacterium]
MNQEYCTDQVRRLDNDRYLCSLFAPEADRSGLFALAAFNIELARIRETVSEPLLGMIRLQWWRDALTTILEGGDVPEHPVVQALAQTIGTTPLRVELLMEMIDAREQDLDPPPPADLAVLEGYCAATSGALAEAFLDVLRLEAQSARATARQVGTAWGLCGLARAAPFHARQGKSFLPGIGADSLPSTAVPRVVLDVLDLAQDLIQTARQNRRDLPSAALPVLLPAVLVDLYCRDLRNVGGDPFNSRLKQRRVSRLVSVWGKSWRGRF